MGRGGCNVQMLSAHLLSRLARRPQKSWQKQIWVFLAIMSPLHFSSKTWLWRPSTWAGHGCCCWQNGWRWAERKAPILVDWSSYWNTAANRHHWPAKKGNVMYFEKWIHATLAWWSFFNDTKKGFSCEWTTSYRFAVDVPWQIRRWVGILCNTHQIRSFPNLILFSWSFNCGSLLG